MPTVLTFHLLDQRAIVAIVLFVRLSRLSMDEGLTVIAANIATEANFEFLSRNKLPLDRVLEAYIVQIYWC